MKVLAIDPGYDRIGIAVLEKEHGVEMLRYSHCLLTNRSHSLAERLHTLGTEIERLLGIHTPDMLAIETLFFNKNIKTAIGVAQARGVILYLAHKHHCLVTEYGPQEIKVAVTGYGNSDKLAVIAMVKQLVQNVPTDALDDEYDAIAVGITALAHHRS